MWRLVTVLAVATWSFATPAKDSSLHIDPSVLEEVFGKPPTTTASPDSTALEHITVKPTDSTMPLTDKDGAACKCVPYYLCDSELNGVFMNNKSVTGYGIIDIRFGEDPCQSSLERCCKVPKDEEEPTPTPTPPPVRGCGYRNPNGIDIKITGGNGNEAQFGEYPWVVALLSEVNQSYVGVGVLIHPQVVLTGAHVARFFEPGTLKIRAGEWDTATDKEILKHQERIVSEIYMHKDFNQRNLHNDVALLRLAEPLQLAQHINVICMPSQDEDFDASKNCVSNGWGKDVFGKKGVYAVILKRVEVDMVPHGQCNSILKQTRLGKHYKLDNSFVCAGGEKGKDTCKGDGGGPLACPIEENRYKLTGLVAWGIGCGEEGIPAVYAAVPRFRNWVDDKMKSWGYDIEGYNI